jgi:hypothetical protein
VHRSGFDREVQALQDRLLTDARFQILNDEQTHVFISRSQAPGSALETTISGKL